MGRIAECFADVQTPARVPPRPARPSPPESLTVTVRLDQLRTVYRRGHVGVAGASGLRWVVLLVRDPRVFLLDEPLSNPDATL